MMRKFSWKVLEVVFFSLNAFFSCNSVFSKVTDVPSNHFDTLRQVGEDKFKF